MEIRMIIRCLDTLDYPGHRVNAQGVGWKLTKRAKLNHLAKQSHSIKSGGERNGNQDEIMLSDSMLNFKINDWISI